MARIVARTTIIDTLLISFIMTTMRTEAEIATELFNAVESDSVKNSLLRTMAARTLEPEKSDEFSALLRRVNERKAERNKIAHGIWGISDEHPTGLVWMNPKDFLADISVLFAFGKGAQTVPIGNPKPGTAMVYEEADFIDIERRLIEIAAEVSVFWTSLVR